MTTMLPPNVQKALDEIRSDPASQPITDPPLREIKSVQFGMLSTEEILGLSVCEVTESRVAQPPNNTVYDDRMGPCSSKGLCSSCGKDIRICPGHPGHITFAEPIIHPMFVKDLLSILTCICPKCSKLKITEEEINLEVGVQHDRFLRYSDRLKIIVDKCSNIAYCNDCNFQYPNKVVEENGDIYEIYENSNGKAKSRIEISNLEHILLNISQEDLITIGFQPEKRVIMKHGKIPCEEETFRPENLLLSHLSVIPPMSRPPDHTGGTRSDDDLTTSYTDIVKDNEKLKGFINEEKKGNTVNEVERQKTRDHFKKHVKALFDNSDGTITRSSGKVAKGIKERIQGKGGIVRGNCAGKRVDESCRTVITSGPDLEMDQVGIPEEIAAQLSYQEKVTARSYRRLKELLDNGKINSVKRDGKTIKVKYALEAGRTIKLKPNDIVYRHLQNGDRVVLNRQPTLHRGSMMGHRVVIVKGKTIQLNPAVTTPYNADFDGDEMQAHVPQDAKTVFEVENIMGVDKMIVSSQASKPIVGIIQDTQTGIFLLTKKGCDISRKTFMNCVMSAGKDYVRKLPEVIKRAKGLGIDNLYSGKILFSILLPEDFHYTKKNDGCKDEPVLRIENGILVEGTINKKVIGRSGGSIIHRLYKEYGTTVCAKFITSIQFLVNRWLDHNGFSVGFADFIINKENEQGVQDSIEKAFIEVEQIQEGDDEPDIKEIRINNALNNRGQSLAINGLCENNRLMAMVESGAKGSQMNIIQIAGHLGQNTVEGKRVQKEIDNGSRTLPCYARGNEHPVTRGFIRSSFLRGLEPDEFFSHAKAGREGMINTAIKTSDSGYAERKLVKRMEDMSVNESGTITNSVGNVICFNYGDGYDPTLQCGSSGGPSFINIGNLVKQLNTEETSVDESNQEILEFFSKKGYSTELDKRRETCKVAIDTVKAMEQNVSTKNMLVNLNKMNKMLLSAC